MNYLRFLMPMECEATGYGLKGRTPAGRCLVENRYGEGKITIWAQDIRPETRYSIYIIFPDERRFVGVFLGNVNACEKGKIENRQTWDKIMGGKFVLEDFVAVAIVADATDAVISPLCGYRERPVSWRGNFHIAVEEEAPEPEVTTPEPEVTTPEPPRPRTRQAAPRTRKPKEPARPPKPSCGNTETSRAVEAIFGSKPQEPPFEKPDGTGWVRLTISDAVPLPDNRPLLLEEPFVRAAYANYAHLMLGINEEGTEYIIAVPGEYAPDLKAQAKRMGFTKFKPTAATKTAKHGDFGYWLMFVPL